MAEFSQQGTFGRGKHCVGEVGGTGLEQFNINTDALLVGAVNQSDTPFFV